MFPEGRNSSFRKLKLPLLSPNTATLSGNSAPQTPGPEIGLIRTSSALSLTAPDFKQAISASARHGSRSAEKNPRPHPASETRTKEPTTNKQTPRVIRADSTNLLKDSSTHPFHESLTTLLVSRALACRLPLLGGAPNALRCPFDRIRSKKNNTWIGVDAHSGLTRHPRHYWAKPTQYQ